MSQSELRAERLALAKARSSTPPPKVTGSAGSGAAHLPSKSVPTPSPGAKATETKSLPSAGKPLPGFRVIYLTVFLDFFANGIILPVLQSHAKGLGASGFDVGLVFTAYSTAQIPGSFIFGRMSDFVGRRPVILVSLLMSTVTLAFTLAAPSLQHLIAARALAGFFSETSVCQAYVADQTTAENRAAALGHMGAFIGLGFVVGPATGALLGLFGGFDLAVKFTVVVTALNLLYAKLRLGESLGCSVPGQEPVPQAHADWKSYLRVLLKPVVTLVVIGQFAITLAFMGWDTTFALWARERLGYEQRHTGLAFAWLAIGFFLASWKTRSFAKKPANTFKGGIAGCGLMCAGLLCHRCIFSTLLALPPLFSIGFGYALSEIVFATLVSVHTPKTLQGSLLGSLSASQALARAVAPVVTGHLFDMAPMNTDFAYTTLAVAPAVAAAITVAAFAAMPVEKES